MAKNVIQSTILSINGGVSVAPGASIEIRNAASGQLMPLWLDRNGTQPTPNPTTADGNGFFRVYTDAGRVHITARKDGKAQEWRDVVLPPDLYIGKSTTAPATPITGSLLSGAMLAAGALVEWGSNANGRYWRWESGLQVCTHTLTLQDALGNNILAGTWVYPAGFTVFPYVDHSLRQGLTADAAPPLRQRFGKTTSALGLASVSLRALATGDINWAAGDVMTTDAFAIGRWK